MTMNTKHTLTFLALAGTSFVLSSCYSNTSGMIFDKTSYNAGVKASDIKSGQTIYTDGKNYYTYVPRYRYDMPSYLVNFVGSYRNPDITPEDNKIYVVKKSHEPEISEQGTQLVQLQPDYARYLMGKGPAPAASTLTAVDNDVLHKCIDREYTTMTGSDTTLQQFNYSSPNAFWLYTAGVFDFLCVDIPLTCIGNAWYFVGGGLGVNYVSEDELTNLLRQENNLKQAAAAQKEANRREAVRRASTPTGNLSNDRSIIYKAIRNYNFSRLEQIVYSTEVNKEAVLSELWNAAIARNVEAVRIMVKVSGLNINHQNYHGRTILHVMAEKGYTEIVQLLLTVPGISVYITDHAGRMPINQAAISGHQDIVRLLKSGSYY